MNRYELVAFDFDGTLADSFPFFLEVFDTLADAHGFRRLERDRIDELRGYDLRRMIAHAGLPPWKVPRVALHFKSLMADNISRIALFEGASEMLHGLSRAGVRLAVVSSNSAANVRAVLGGDTAHLIEYYDCGVALLGKRARLKRLVKKSGLAPRQVLYVGDETRDIDAASAAGIAAGAVTWGYATPSALANRDPTVLFSSFEEIARRVSGAG